MHGLRDGDAPLVHAKLAANGGPLELAARAANSVELVGDDDGPSIVTLLE